MLQQLLNNQIAMAMIVFIILAVGSFIVLDPPTIKEVIVQLITAIGSLVTGIGLERFKNSRSTDQITGTSSSSSESEKTK